MSLRNRFAAIISRLLFSLGAGFPLGVAAGAANPPGAEIVLLKEGFEQTDGPLAVASEKGWKSVRGESLIIVRERQAFIPGEAKAEAYVARPFDQAPPPGSELEASFTLRVDTRAGIKPAAEGSTGIVFQFASADGRQRRARLALRINADGSCQVGVTAKSSSAIVWAAGEVSRFEEHAVVVRYDPQIGRVSLWVDALKPGTAPLAQATDPETLMPAQVSLQQSGKAGAPDVRVSDLIVRARPAGEAARGSAPEVKSPAPAPAASSAPKEAGLTPAAKGFRVFLLLGQSNMAGRGVVEPSDQAGKPNILTQQADGRWLVAREPLHWDKPRVAGVGPGLAFARALLPKLPAGASIGLIPAAFGGTRVAWWQKNYDGTQRWPDGETYFQHAVASARAVPKGSLAGILWLQGESDKGAAELDGGAAYRRDLYAFIRDLRAELDSPELPFVVATLKPWSTDNSHALNAIFLALPKEIPRTAVVDTNAPALEGLLKNKTDDPPHYDSPSARRIGELFAREMLPLLKTTAR